MTRRMRFGIFLAPIHKPGINPARARAARPDGPLFHVELLYGGVFAIGGVPPEEMEPVLLIECPRYLFPFARRIIAEVTAEGGFPPFLLDPIDFAGVYAARKAQEPQVGHA